MILFIFMIFQIQVEISTIKYRPIVPLNITVITVRSSIAALRVGELLKELIFINIIIMNRFKYLEILKSNLAPNVTKVQLPESLRLKIIPWKWLKIGLQNTPNQFFITISRSFLIKNIKQISCTFKMHIHF